MSKWKEFGELTRSCYMTLAGLEQSQESWDQAYETLKEILAEERRSQPEYGAELYQLDEITDYEYDVQGWLEDYLDDLDFREDKEKLLKVCDELVELFRWEEEVPSDIRFMKASALRELGRNEEALEYCKAWRAEDADNLVAVAASVYACMAVQDMEAAEKLIVQYIPEGEKCTDENDILFTAAAKFYEAAGNKEAFERIDEELEAYDKALGAFFEGVDEEDLYF